ncbi:hypothetical protein [Qipengyuania sp. MTN3-11]|uniref:hypothetical protein n=1 Tax=Qipengyuania sp. MTN3-11 TaxID=3056557 RepID=UPI0036F4412C
MEQHLAKLATCADRVAQCARDALASSEGRDEMRALNEAMIAYRGAAVFYLTQPSIADFVRADALRYDKQTREAMERIADLIDRLNEV